MRRIVLTAMTVLATLLGLGLQPPPVAAGGSYPVASSRPVGISDSPGPVTPSGASGRVPPAQLAGVSDWVRPPRPAGATRALLLYDTVNPQQERDVWVEPHLELSNWSTIVNNLPFWRYVYHTRFDVPTDVALHFGTCQPNRPCIRLYDGYLGTPNDLAQTHGWLDSAGRIVGWTAVTFNNSYFAPSSPYAYDDDGSRGAVLCHEAGHSLGLLYHRDFLNEGSCMLNPSPESGMPTVLNSLDRGYLNDKY